MDSEEDLLEQQVECDLVEYFVNESNEAQDDPELPEEILKILYEAALEGAME